MGHGRPAIWQFVSHFLLAGFEAVGESFLRLLPHGKPLVASKEELGMFVHKVFPGEPLHLTIKDQIPRPYEILPSGSILFSPGQEHKA